MIFDISNEFNNTVEDPNPCQENKSQDPYEITYEMKPDKIAEIISDRLITIIKQELQSGTAVTPKPAQ